MNYYVYIYLREDGSPYNVGKGKGKRWCSKNHRVEVPPADRVIFPVTQTTEDWAHFMEMHFIDLYGRLNDGTGILENWTDGGEGSSGHRHSEISKQKMSMTRKGKPSHRKNKSHSEISKQKMSETHTGMKHSEETKQKISAAHKGVPKLEETKRKLSEALKGIQNTKGMKHSEETKQKMREATKNRKPVSEESRRRMSESRKGVKRGPYKNKQSNTIPQN